MNKKKNLEFCLASFKPGSYNGLLVFEVENGRLGVGSWIRANITGDEKYVVEDEDIKSLNLPEVIREDFSSSFVFFLLEEVFLLFAFFAVFLLFVKRKEDY